MWCEGRTRFFVAMEAGRILFLAAESGRVAPFESTTLAEIKKLSPERDSARKYEDVPRDSPILNEKWWTLHARAQFFLKI